MKKKKQACFSSTNWKKAKETYIKNIDNIEHIYQFSATWY